MPLSKEHKERSREKILDSAASLFSQHGYDKISIDDVMTHAGMTRGAFYAHFDSKQDLYAQAIRRGAQASPVVKQYFKGSRGQVFMDTLINGYLSSEHLRRTIPCPLAFLATDVANNDKQVRSVYTEVFGNLIQLMENETSDKSKQRQQDLLLAVGAMMIGGVAVSRALVDKELTERLLASCRTLAGELVG